jgi:nitric-oxide synthase
MPPSDPRPATCPFTGRVWPTAGNCLVREAGAPPVDPAAATEAFLDLVEQETGVRVRPEHRAEAQEDVRRLGFCRQTAEELELACRLAWRNNRRCIGRRFWETLEVADRRNLREAGEIFEACVEHLRRSTNGGKIRPLITVFAPASRADRGPRIRNYQLIRYAGYRQSDGRILGDPSEVRFTETVRQLGWQPPARRTAFDVLPLLIETRPDEPRLFELPADAILEVPLEHPDYSWFAALDLKWHALPAVSNMTLDAGAARYPAAPFSGYYMETEVAARNLGDTHRYNLLPVVADRLDPRLRAKDPFWRDRALVELCTAVLHSFRRDGVTIVDHHAASRQFADHLEQEEKAGRTVPGDWSWLVPPVSGSASPVFHRYYDPRQRLPDFVPNED